MPNPQGKDDKELITIWSNKPEEGSEKLYLQSGFYLLINERKKKLSGEFIPGQDNTYYGNFGLLNKAACVSLYYQTMLLDKLCYPQVQENQLIGEGSPILETLDSQTFQILNSISFQTENGKLCAHYQGQKFFCRNLPASKTSLKLKNELKLYKNYLAILQDYFIDQWKTLYYDSDFNKYFQLRAQAKELFKQGFLTVDIFGQKVAIRDFQEQMRLQYEVSSLTYRHRWIEKIFLTSQNTKKILSRGRKKLDTS